jgi:hypothetical protein
MVVEAAEKMRMQAQKESHGQNKAIFMKSFVETSEVLMSSLHKKMSEIVIDVVQIFTPKLALKGSLLVALGLCQNSQGDLCFNSEQ